MSEPIPLDPHIFGAGQPCFGCAPDHPIGFHLRFERDGDDIVTRMTPDDRYQGPPGVMHGGLVTALADELAAWTLLGLRERLGFTAKLSARLHRPVRIGVEVEARGRIEAESTRVFEIEVTLSQEGKRCFQGDFTFALLDPGGVERFLGGPLPEAWKRFAR